MHRRGCPRPGGAVSDQHAPEGLVDAARDAGLRNDLDLEPVLHTPRSLDSLVPGPVTAQGPAQISMTLRKIFVAFMVLLSLALSACGGDNKNPIAPTPAPAPTPTTAPDLVVDAPTVNDNSPATGALFTLSATVRNAGDGESAATTLRFYQSTDGTITTSDTVAGTDAVAGLAASGSYLGSVDLPAPSTAGTYYYGACVDAVTDESDTTNNCSASVTVTVPEPPTSPVETQGCPADAETWRGLKVCDERPRDGYARDAFGTGYSSLEDEIIAALPPTMKANGQVYTPYSCLAFDITANGTAATDIEHIVALAETHDSGIADERRRDIASDLDNLTIADPTVNRSQKSDRDAAEWMPARHGAWFAERVIQVKLEYGLSVDPAERDALEALLAGGEAQLNCVGYYAVLHSWDEENTDSLEDVLTASDPDPTLSVGTL